MLGFCGSILLPIGEWNHPCVCSKVIILEEQIPDRVMQQTLSIWKDVFFHPRTKIKVRGNWQFGVEAYSCFQFVCSCHSEGMAELETKILKHPNSGDVPRNGTRDSMPLM